MSEQKCFACDRPLGDSPIMAQCEDDQIVYVGRECARRIKDAGDFGYQPPKGGPLLYSLEGCDCEWPVGNVRLIRANN